MILMFILSLSWADTATVHRVAAMNGYAPSKAVKQAISNAAEAYNIPVAKMTAIAIVETGIGTFTATKKNKNGTYDKGLFQINSVNKPACMEYDLQTDQGSAMCAAKLLNKLRKKWPLDYYARYHSHTESFRNVYKNKVENVLKRATVKITGN